MTSSEQLAHLDHLDHLEGRLAAMRASAEAFINRRYEPSFVMIPAPEIWAMPRPEAEPPNEWGNVFLASVAMATAITIFAAANTFVRPW